MGQRVYNQDLELILADGAAAVTADGQSQVGGAAAEKKLGPGRFEGVLIIDVSAIDISSADEVYHLCLQGAASGADAFTTTETLAQISLGATAARPGAAINSVIGRYEIPFITEQHDTVYDWVRLYVDVAGTTPSITFKAWIAERY
ncbi:hypothetical protein SM0020_12240 [Sinorhizobium meliloti CCNWSX0020]|uniref:Uncharacterized protein n=1 Tax=Sinorhizobium meliloti CCNWSX0020 TaxID=1107881 RepID=H0FZ14_RHIML|nr:hypothetical protein [Sinorhizobium meliloti]EHK77694.1 hypothetical protein SM0020_12240 [Sinorhizobium meliloti CCNWSX0020]